MESGSDYYRLVDGEGGSRQEGPVASDVIVSMLGAGALSPDTLDWREGMSDWVSIGATAELAPGTPAGAEQGGGPREAAEPSGEAQEIGAPGSGEPSVEEAGAAGPSDRVLMREFDAYGVYYSRPRKSLLVVTSEYHADPLALTKLDLRGFLTAIETAEP